MPYLNPCLALQVPPKFFDLLTEIGRHREEGLLQPILTKITNQDARSVGPRTAALAKMGYIEKINVLAAKLRTSKLTLQRYATIRDLKEKRLRKQATQEGTKVGKNNVNAPWTGDTVDVKKMVDAIFAELKKAKNHVLMHNDIKRKLVSFKFYIIRSCVVNLPTRVWTSRDSIFGRLLESSAELRRLVA